MFPSILDHPPPKKRVFPNQSGGQMGSLCIPGPSKGCPMDYPTLPRHFHWAPLGWSRYIYVYIYIYFFLKSLVPRLPTTINLIGITESTKDFTTQTPGQKLFWSWKSRVVSLPAPKASHSMRNCLTHSVKFRSTEKSCKASGGEPWTWVGRCPDKV